MIVQTIQGGYNKNRNPVKDCGQQAGIYKEINLR